jgi:hypothetical protein
MACRWSAGALHRIHDQPGTDRRREEARQVNYGDCVIPPVARNGVGSAAAVRAGEGGGRLGPLNGSVGSGQAREAGAPHDNRLDS